MECRVRNTVGLSTEAFLLTYTTLGGSLLQLLYLAPQNPIVMIKAPTLGFKLCSGFRLPGSGVHGLGFLFLHHVNVSLRASYLSL